VPSSWPHVWVSAAGPDRQPERTAQHRRPLRGRHGSAQLAMRGEYTVVSRQVHPRRRHQRGQPCHEIQRLDHDVRGAVPVWGLERVAHMARRSQAQASRLGQRARAGEILFSDSVKRVLDQRAMDVGAMALPSLVLRGRTAPVDIFCVPSGERVDFRPH
jgi:hypothetical protein